MAVNADYILDMIDKVSRGEIKQSPVFYCNIADQQEVKKRLGGFEVVGLDKIEVI